MTNEEPKVGLPGPIHFNENRPNRRCGAPRRSRSIRKAARSQLTYYRLKQPSAVSGKLSGETKFWRRMQEPLAVTLQFEDLSVILHQSRMVAHADERRGSGN